MNQKKEPRRKRGRTFLIELEDDLLEKLERLRQRQLGPPSRTRLIKALIKTELNALLQE